MTARRVTLRIIALFSIYPLINLIKRDLHKHHFKFKEITCAEVWKAMNDLNPNKLWGHDRLDPKIMKVGANELAPSLTVIFNRTIRNGEWIAKLK